MMKLNFYPLATSDVRRIQNGGADANGQTAERGVSTGIGTPCRHCLDTIPKGAEMLIFAYRPFDAPQPYAEIGPIFLCANECKSHAPETVPPILKLSPDYLIKGYGPDDRIVYGTGKIVPMAELETESKAILAQENVDYVHARSARNNCYLCKMTPA